MSAIENVSATNFKERRGALHHAECARSPPHTIESFFVSHARLRLGNSDLSDGAICRPEEDPWIGASAMGLRGSSFRIVRQLRRIARIRKGQGFPPGPSGRDAGRAVRIEAEKGALRYAFAESTGARVGKSVSRADET